MTESIYDKYGGFAAVSGIVHSFYRRVLDSATLRPYFARTDMERLIHHQTQFLCMVLGGPDNYEGRGLQAAHRAHAISPAAFDEVAGHLRDALQEAALDPQDIAKVLALVASRKAEIVGG